MRGLGGYENEIYILADDPAFGSWARGKLRRVACPRTLAESLQAYGYRHELPRDERLFPINRFRAYQIITAAAKKAGLEKRVYPHLLRHSDSI